MSACERQFRVALKLVDDLYAEVNGHGRYLVQSKRTHHDSWILSCTDLFVQYWEKELFYEDVLQQKQASGLGREPWQCYFERLVEAFASDSLIVSSNKHGIKLTAHCYSSSKQLSYSYYLDQVEAEDLQPKVTDLVFELLSFSRRMKKSEQEAKELFSLSQKQDEPSSSRYEHSASQSQSLSSSSSSGSSTLGSQSSVATSSSAASLSLPQVVPTKTQAKRRRPGFSIVNPRVKRWQGERGARIQPTASVEAKPTNPQLERE